MSPLSVCVLPTWEELSQVCRNQVDETFRCFLHTNLTRRESKGIKINGRGVTAKRCTDERAKKRERKKEKEERWPHFSTGAGYIAGSILKLAVFSSTQ